jgi:hypothetical protein
MAFNRDCLSILDDAQGRASVLLVSSDEERESFRSDILCYEDFAGEPQTVFSDDIWLSWMWKTGSGRHFACEILGSVFWQTGQGFQREKLSPDQLFRIWGLSDSSVYTVGATGRCFGFDGSRWSDMSKGLKGYLHAIHGVSPNRLVCAGDTGFVAFWDGEKWTPLDLQIGFNFRAALMLAPDDTIVCGLDGACVRIKGETMELIEGTTASLYAIARFKGEIFLGSAEAGIFRLQDSTLEPFKPKARGYDISASHTRLLTCGVNQAAAFNGESWKARTFS